MKHFESKSLSIEIKVLSFMHVNTDIALYNSYALDRNHQKVFGAIWNHNLKAFAKKNKVLETKIFEHINQRLANSEDDFRKILKREFNKSTLQDFHYFKQRLIEEINHNLLYFPIHSTEITLLNKYLEFKNWIILSSTDDFQYSSELLKKEIIPKNVLNAIFDYNNNHRIFDLISIDDLYNVFNSENSKIKLKINPRQKSHFFHLLTILFNFLYLPINYIEDILKKGNITDDIGNILYYNDFS